MAPTKAPEQRYPKRQTKPILKNLNVAKVVTPRRRYPKRKRPAHKVRWLFPAPSKYIITSSDKLIQEAEPSTEKDIFPFEKLPPELRNKIYSFALTNADHGIHLGTKRQWDRKKLNWHNVLRIPKAGDRSHRKPGGDCQVFKPPRPSLLVPNLLALNHQIHTEASAILYGGNTFVLDNERALHAFCTTIGPRNCAALRVLRVLFWLLNDELDFTVLSSAVNVMTLKVDFLYPGDSMVRK